MNIFNIPQLNWKDYASERAVVAAHEDLEKITAKAVTLHSLALVPEAHHGSIGQLNILIFSGFHGKRLSDK